MTSSIVYRKVLPLIIGTLVLSTVLVFLLPIPTFLIAILYPVIVACGIGNAFTLNKLEDSNRRITLSDVNFKRAYFLLLLICLMFSAPTAGFAFFCLGIGFIIQERSLAVKTSFNIGATIFAVTCCFGISALLIISTFTATAVVTSIPFLITEGILLLLLVAIVVRCSILNDKDHNNGIEFTEVSPIFTNPFKTIDAQNNQIMNTAYHDNIDNANKIYTNNKNEIHIDNNGKVHVKAFKAFQGQAHSLG